MPANVAETFQHYQVLRREDGSLWELGRGAMGVTYKAFDTNLRSHVCLKVISAAHLDSETARARFLREARAAAGLRHRNVASVYHLGNDDQSFFYAMEFVDGETVETLVKRGTPLAPPDALNITLQVARALGAAHRQGLVHRDIKPANLMVSREDEDEDERLVKVIDFGLARPAANAEGSAHITLGGFVGTPQYSSPEQLQEGDLDTRSDIYSLGITLWFMLTGRPPFTGPLGNVFVQHLTKPPPWDQLGALTHGPVHTLLARMLAKDPAGRPQTPAELRREIEVCLRALAGASTFVPVAPAGRAIRPAVPLPASAETAVSDVPLPPTVAPSELGAPPAPVSTSAETGSLTPVEHQEDASPDPAEFALEGEAVPPAPDLVEVPRAPAGVGDVLAGRYRLESLAGEGGSGRVFQARDLQRDGRAVALKVLHPGVADAEDLFTSIQADLLKIQGFPHPALLALEGLERDGDRDVFLVAEWANGFSLVDLLRHRGHLAPREVLRLLESAAAAADHARLHGLHGLQLAPRKVMTHFPGSLGGAGTRGADGEGTRSVVGLDLERWPEFTLKLDPLGLTAEGADGGFVTWAGERTLVPGSPRGAPHAGPGGDAGRRTVSRDTQTSILGLFTESYLPAFAALAYELLSGAPPPAFTGGSTPGGGAAQPRLVAVPALREEGNALLRRCLIAPGDTGLASAQEFCDALAEVCGLRSPPPSASPASVAEAAPTMAGMTMPEVREDEAMADSSSTAARTAEFPEAASDQAVTVTPEFRVERPVPLAPAELLADEDAASEATQTPTLAPPEPPTVDISRVERAADLAAGIEPPPELRTESEIKSEDDASETPPTAIGLGSAAPVSSVGEDSETLAPATPFASPLARDISLVDSTEDTTGTSQALPATQEESTDARANETAFTRSDVADDLAPEVSDADGADGPTSETWLRGPEVADAPAPPSWETSAPEPAHTSRPETWESQDLPAESQPVVETRPAPVPILLTGTATAKHPPSWTRAMALAAGGTVVLLGLAGTGWLVLSRRPDPTPPPRPTPTAVATTPAPPPAPTIKPPVLTVVPPTPTAAPPVVALATPSPEPPRPSPAPPAPVVSLPPPPSDPVPETTPAPIGTGADAPPTDTFVTTRPPAVSTPPGPAIEATTPSNRPPTASERETSSRGSAAAAEQRANTAAEARKRREREQQEEQQAEERRGREREREAAEQRARDRARETKAARSSREDPPAPSRAERSKPRPTPTAKASEKAKPKPPPPEDDRPRGPAVPFMR